NAAKYTPSGGRISLTAAAENHEFVFRVKDSGIGIEPAMLPRVFDLFSQGERALDRARGGLGVGLTLVKRLVELHGGTVEARSEGPGKGSELIVRLAEPAMVPPPAAQSQAPAPPSEVPARRVLVVDDD